MKHSLLISLGVATALAAGASAPVQIGSAIYNGHCRLSLGEPIVGLVGTSDATHATMGHLQGILEIEGNTEAEALLAELHYSFYPNPTESLLHIKKGGETDAQLQLFSLDGRLLKSLEVKGNETTLDLSDLPADIYLLKLKDQASQKTITERIIKH